MALAGWNGNISDVRWTVLSFPMAPIPRCNQLHYREYEETGDVADENITVTEKDGCLTFTHNSGMSPNVARGTRV